MDIVFNMETMFVLISPHWFQTFLCLTDNVLAMSSNTGSRIPDFSKELFIKKVSRKKTINITTNSFDILLLSCFPRPGYICCIVCVFSVIYLYLLYLYLLSICYICYLLICFIYLCDDSATMVKQHTLWGNHVWTWL